MTEKDEEMVKKLWMERVKERAHLDTDCCLEDEVEQGATWCEEALSNVLDATAMKIRICAKSKRLWNCKIKEKRNILGQQKRRGWNTEAAAQAKAEFQKSIQKYKRQMWSDHLQNHRAAEVWRVVKYVNPRSGATVEALTDREDQDANTDTEKEEMLRRESFPQNNDDQYY
jgi:hypothetical protein